MIEVRKIETSAGDFCTDHNSTFLFSELEIGVCSIFLIQVSMNFKDSSTLYFIFSGNTIRVLVLDVVKDVVKVLHLINGAHKNHDFRAFNELEISNHQGNSLFLRHQNILLLQVFRYVDLLGRSNLLRLFFISSFFLKANVCRIIHA